MCYLIFGLPTGLLHEQNDYADGPYNCDRNYRGSFNGARFFANDSLIPLNILLLYQESFSLLAILCLDSELPTPNLFF